MYRPPQLLSVSDATWFGFIGIVIAAAIYSLLAVIIGLMIALFTVPWPITVDEVVSGALMIFFGVAFGVMIAAFAGLISCTLTATFNWSLGHIWHPITSAGIAGGMAGFLSTCVLPATALVNAPPSGILMVVFLGPILAMMMGHLGAIRFATLSICSHYERQQVKVHRLFAKEIKDNVWQFELKQMLILTAWFGLLFGLLSAVSSMSWVPAVMVVGYLGFQLVTYSLCTWMTSNWVERRFSEYLINEPPLGPKDIQYGRVIERDSDPFSPGVSPRPYRRPKTRIEEGT